MSYFTSGLPFIEWLGSEAGRRFMLKVGGLGGPAVACIYWLPHSLLLNKTKDWLQMYDDAIPVRPVPVVIDLIAEALADCGITESDARTFRWFTTFSFDPIHKGQLSFNQGAIIGLPKPFFWKSVDEINRSGIRMYRDKAIPWRSEAGEAFQTALILSDEAKKFAIAREVHAVCTSYALTKTLLLAFPIPVFTTIAATLIDHYGIYRLSAKKRVVLYSGWGALCLIFMVTTFDLLNRYYQKWEDVETCKVSESYAKGGVEYYSKILLRNRALRELLGSSGMRSYNEDGDIKHWIKWSERPFTQRKKICQTQLDEHVKERTNPTVKKTEEKLVEEPGSTRRRINPMYSNVSTGKPILGLKGASMEASMDSTSTGVDSVNTAKP